MHGEAEGAALTALHCRPPRWAVRGEARRRDEALACVPSTDSMSSWGQQSWWPHGRDSREQQSASHGGWTLWGPYARFHGGWDPGDEETAGVEETAVRPYRSRRVTARVSQHTPRASSPGGERCGMRLFIRTLRGLPQLLNVNENDKEWRVLSLAAPGSLPVDYAVTWDGHLVDLDRALVSYRFREDHVIQAVRAPRVRDGEHRPRQLRQMAEAIVQYREKQGRADHERAPQEKRDHCQRRLL